MASSPGGLEMERISSWFYLACAGIAVAAALTQFVMIGLLGLLLLPVFLVFFVIAVWRLRQQQLNSLVTWCGGLLLVYAGGASGFVASAAANLTLLTFLSSHRSAVNVPVLEQWGAPIFIWLSVIAAARVGFAWWTQWPARQAMLYTWVIAAIVPVAVVVFVVLSLVLPVSA